MHKTLILRVICTLSKFSNDFYCESNFTAHNENKQRRTRFDHDDVMENISKPAVSNRN